MAVIHSPGALITGISRLYGSDFAMVFVKPKQNMNSYFYEIQRKNVTAVSNENMRCTTEIENPHPGLAKDKDDIKMIDKCISNYYVRKLGCKLPWSKNQTILSK